MSGLLWVIVGSAAVLSLAALYPIGQVLRRQRRQKLIDRFGQLGSQLEERIGEPSQTTEEQAAKTNSKKILQMLQESESQPNRLEPGLFSSVLTSIHPVKSSVADLATRLAQWVPQDIDHCDQQSLDMTSLAVVYIRSHLSVAIRVNEMARDLGVPQKQLYYCLRESLGCSAQELINVVKMQEAKRILRSEDILVKEVAERLGYWSPYHFSKRFKLFYGVAPNDFKAHYQKREKKKIAESAVDDASDSFDMSCAQEQTKVDQVEPCDHQELPRGSNLSRYVIIEPIGSGGMGTVYRAYDPQLNRGVALKILSVKHEKLQAAESAKARLIREAQALARLSHPNVVAVHDAGTFEDDVFIAMELVEGKTLNNWMRESHRTVKEVLKVMTAAGKGLAAAHKAGLIHRDFKPGNVIVGNDGRVRVLDFGLARAADQGESLDEAQVSDRTGLSPLSKDPYDLEDLSSESSTDLLQAPLTREGGVLGTPLYMSPEQHLGLKTDERTDQFGFCVVLYEALYGKRPYIASSIEQLKREVIRQRVRVPQTGTDVPEWLWHIIRKGLRVKPEDRFPNFDRLLQDLEKDPQAARRQKQQARRRKLVIVSLLVSTIGLPFGVWYGLRYRTVQLCKDTDSEFVGVWDDATQNSVKTAFLDTKTSYAPGTWKRVQQTTDRYLSEWKQLRGELCESKLLRGTLSEELFDLQMSCLQKRKRELKAFMKIFADADRKVVQKAVQAISSLAGIAVCADKEALHAPYPPPKTAAGKTKVAAIRERLAEVKALNKTGKYKEGLALSKELETEAKAIDYKPVRAEVSYHFGLLFSRVGDYKKSESALVDASRWAGESKNALLAAEAMISLVEVVGYVQSRHTDALLIARDVEVVMGLAERDDALKARLLINLGILSNEKNEYDKALAYIQESLAIRKKMLGSDHPYLARPLNAMGLVYSSLYKFDKAMDCYRNALAILEKALGPEHPDVAVALFNIGRELKRQGEYGSALKYLHKSLAIDEKALGPDHPELAYALHYLGIVYGNSGQYDKALKFFLRAIANWEATLGLDHRFLAWPLNGIGNVSIEIENWQQAIAMFSRSLSICQKYPCEKETHGLALFGLAQALIATDGDENRAIKLAKQARELLREKPKVYKKELEEMNAWLLEQTKGKLNQKND